jgi:hypothetical protein
MEQNLKVLAIKISMIRDLSIVKEMRKFSRMSKKREYKLFGTGILKIQGISRVIMNPLSTLHLERKTWYGRGKCPALHSKCIVGCIFNSDGCIITGEIPCIFLY